MDLSDRVEHNRACVLPPISRAIALKGIPGFQWASDIYFRAVAHDRDAVPALGLTRAYRRVVYYSQRLFAACGIWDRLELLNNAASGASVMHPVLSVAIPARNEERYIGRCLESVMRSAKRANQHIEVIVALDQCTDGTREIAESYRATCVVEDRKSIAAVRNAAVRASRAAAIVTLDADSWMSEGTVEEIIARVFDIRYVGGGTVVLPERWSVGIVFSVLAVMPYVLTHRVSIGMLWLLRDTFEALGGFNEEMVSVEDLDFALRLKALGRARGQKYGTIWRQGITTSCRKFDEFGDWYLFRNPRLVRRIFTGIDRAAADSFYYDVKR
jgi:glycosyltransferase involved in cell wall biosynthesis